MAFSWKICKSMLYKNHISNLLYSSRDFDIISHSLRNSILSYSLDSVARNGILIFYHVHNGFLIFFHILSTILIFFPILYAILLIVRTLDAIL